MARTRYLRMKRTSRLTIGEARALLEALPTMFLTPRLVAARVKLERAISDARTRSRGRFGPGARVTPPPAVESEQCSVS